MVMSEKAKNFQPDGTRVRAWKARGYRLDWRSIRPNACGLAQNQMSFVSRGEHHLAGKVLGIMPTAWLPSTHAGLMGNVVKENCLALARMYAHGY